MPDVARTLDLPSAQRFEYWKHVLSHTFVPLEVSTPSGDADFRGRLRGCELGSLRFIEVSAEVGEADLSPAQIAAAHHISLRQLHKLFHAGGTTVAGWIRQRRLEHCGHDLRDPRWAARPVAAVGARWGYPDPAHFSRLFKASFGLSPRDYRAAWPYVADQGACAGVQDGRWPTA